MRREGRLDRAMDQNRKDTQLRLWNDGRIAGLFLFMVLIAVVLLFPYVFMINKSLMTSAMVINPQVSFFPDFRNLQFGNYFRLFTTNVQGHTFGEALGNTMLVILFNIIAVPLSASMAAFAFSKLRWRGKNVVFASMMLTIMLPGIVTQIPLYVIYARIGWLNTLKPFTLPNLFGGGALYIFLIRQYMMGIPNELVDAAKVDGCNYFRIYWQIVLPNCRTIIIYIMVNVFMATWGDYYGPLLYMSSADAPYTFAYVLFKNFTEGDVAADLANIRMAGGVFMTIVPAIIFMVFQRELTNSAVTSGLKG